MRSIEALCHSLDDWQRIGIRFCPEGTQLAQEDIHRDRPDAVEREQPLLEQPLLEIARVAGRIVQLAQTAAVNGDERFAVAEDLRRFATVIADIAKAVRRNPRLRKRREEAEKLNAADSICYQAERTSPLAAGIKGSAFCSEISAAVLISVNVS